MVLFDIEKIQQGINEAWLLFSLHKTISLRTQKRVEESGQYVFQVQFSLTTDVSVRIKRRSYPLPKIDGHVVGKRAHRTG